MNWVCEIPIHFSNIVFRKKRRDLKTFQFPELPTPESAVLIQTWISLREGSCIEGGVLLTKTLGYGAIGKVLNSDFIKSWFEFMTPGREIC